MEFHISRAARDRYQLADLLFSYTGNVVFANVAASRELAARVNEVRSAEESTADPAVAAERVLHAGALFAMGLIDELSHALVAEFHRSADPVVFTEALRWFGQQAGPEATEEVLARFSERFPTVAVYRGELPAAEWLTGSAEGVPNREAASEELLMLWLANLNPAFRPFAEFFDDSPLRDNTRYSAVTGSFDAFFATRPSMPGHAGTLLDLLRAPMLASPDSLSGQLAYIRENWTPFLGEGMRRLLLGIDVLREEELAIWMRFNPPSEADRRAAEARRRAGQWGSDEAGRPYYDGPPDFSQATFQHEYEAFSRDEDWMPNVVLLAKSTYVWLEQLSRKYGRHIYRLDHIPEEELALIAGRGLNGLWLIGIWERSKASERIKHLRGQGDAVASAYSLADYRIADDLGGNAAYEVLRDRAVARGIRLASDMVPNHMGIDSHWVIEHPEWFLSRPDSPYPSYSFNGPDLSADPRVEIKLEDHYYDQTDAAVAFRLREHATGRTEFVYHGNDGTSFAWNDTAQLDYSKSFVREQVIQTILSVARLFPIIRFDAAMVLAKKHVQRLWFPLPGTGGSIPSRAEFAMSQAEFDALMPNEFWREVVDRVAAEVPGTLLLAEAFWLLEGYFVRTLGMHRVYNSAFMNMLRDEENAKYRSVIKNTIEFDPDILKRYVNFMSNPDERTAIDQFGSGDRYFGVATLMATLPGLPMFGHGQIEAFTEKYGMEYKRARYEEWPNEDLVARHQREIAPLLKQRQLFAESSNFVLYDFWTGDGSVDENVYAYSNRLGDRRALIIFNNRFGDTRGTLHTSAASMDKTTGKLKQPLLGEALALRAEENLFLAWRDTASNLEYLRRSSDLAHGGLTFDLRAYQYAVLLNWRELTATVEQPWDRLCDALNGAGVYSLEEALSKLRFRRVHSAVRDLLQPSLLQAAIAESAAPRDASELLTTIESRATVIVREMLDAGVPLPEAPEAIGGRVAEAFAAVLRVPQLEASFSSTWPADAREVLPSASPHTRATGVWAPVFATTLVRAIAPEASAALFDELQLRSALAEIFSSLGFEGEDNWRAAARVRLGLQHAEETIAPDFGEPFWSDPDARWLIGVNRHGGVDYFNQQSFVQAVWWLHLPAVMALALAPDGAVAALEGRISAAVSLAAGRGYQVAEYLPAASMARGANPDSSSATPSPRATRPAAGKPASAAVPGAAAGAPPAKSKGSSSARPAVAATVPEIIARAAGRARKGVAGKAAPAKSAPGKAVADDEGSAKPGKGAAPSPSTPKEPKPAGNKRK